MPVYRHKVDGYEIQAYGGRGSIRGELYVNLYGYAKGKPDTQQGSVTKRDIYLTEKDFNRLFELVPEYCCSEFESMVQKGVYYLKDNEWYMVYRDDTLECSRMIHGCPFCLRPLKDIRAP